MDSAYLLPMIEIFSSFMKKFIYTFTVQVSQQASAFFQVNALTIQAEGKIRDRNGTQPVILFPGC